MTTWKIKHTHCTHAHENTEPTDTATAQTHQRQMPCISFVQVSGMGMGDACPANKVTVICPILFQNWSCYRGFLWKAQNFSLLCANTETACLESTLWRQINKVKCNMINIIESLFISPLKMFQIDLLPGLYF